MERPPGQSIKTRVEASPTPRRHGASGVRLDNPLKQGLKLPLGQIYGPQPHRPPGQSIKTRVEAPILGCWHPPSVVSAWTIH